jgi:hypothetical protein
VVVSKLADVSEVLTSTLVMEAVSTSEMSVNYGTTRRSLREDSSEHHTRRRENLKSHFEKAVLFIFAAVRELK